MSVVGCGKCVDGLVDTVQSREGDVESGPYTVIVPDYCTCEAGIAAYERDERAWEEHGRMVWAHQWAGLLKDALQGQDPMTCEWSLIGRTAEEFRIAETLMPVKGPDAKLPFLIDYVMFEAMTEDGPVRLTENVRVYAPTVITDAITRYVPVSVPSVTHFSEHSFDVQELTLACDFLDGRALVWARDLLGRAEERATRTPRYSIPTDVAERIEQMCANVAEHIAVASRA